MAETELVRDESNAVEQYGESTSFMPERIAETSATRQAAQAGALVQARYAIAIRRPRSMDNVRALLLKECRRSGFADGARYEKPVGGDNKAKGYSIRFAEAAARSLGNIQVDVSTVYDDMSKRTIRVEVADLEINYPTALEVTLEKTVERKYLRKFQTPLGKRTNTKGETVYIVEATEDDFLVKQNSNISKLMRNCILRFIPGDILDDCEAEILKTINAKVAQDPDAEKKKILDGFMGLNILPASVEEYLGHPLDQVTPAELVQLRHVYTALKDGEANWQDVISERRAERGQAPKAEGAAPNGKPRNLSELGAKVAADRAAQQQPKPSNEPDEFDRVIGAPAAANGPTTGTGTSDVPPTAGPVAQREVPLAERSLDEVSAVARNLVDGVEFTAIVRRHGGERGKLGFGLGGDSQKALKAEFLALVEKLQRPTS